MCDRYLEPPGVICQLADLKIQKALDLAYLLTLNEIPFVKLIEFRKLEELNSEVIVFDLEIELGQRLKYDIHKHERIAVIFNALDENFPEVLALRVDFPKLMHLNLRKDEFPRSLCLYEENYNELKLRWTSIDFIVTIRDWLALNAKGKLHQEDQALERVLLDGLGKIIIPFDLFEKDTDKPEILGISSVKEGKNGYLTLITKRISEKQNSYPYVVISLKTSPQVHGVINQSPVNVYELHKLLEETGINLLDNLRVIFKEWLTYKPFDNFLYAKLIILIAFPMKRYEESEEPEVNELWAFVCPTNSIGEIGQQIGIYEKHAGNFAPTLGNVDSQKNGENIGIIPLNTVFSLSRNMAAICNGSPECSVKISAIGLGALGSQVFINLIRAGFGEWNLIDHDYLLPHNLTRHALIGSSVGDAKATSLAKLANSIIDGSPIARAFDVNVLRLGDRKDEVLNILKESDLIIDMSTSIAVERFISRDLDSKSRRISLFLTPSGMDLVLFSEDIGRKIKLDMIEMQYYKLLINEPNLDGHLFINKNSIRYSNSCRDRSFIISQDLVALHSALGSRGIKSAIDNANSSIIIWRVDSEDLNVKCFKYQPKEMNEYKLGEWVLYIDQETIDKITSYRKSKLPNETGGILIGAHDLQRKIVYVIDTELSPPDSQEWPTLYIRGCQGLKQRLEAVKDITLGMIGYAGEWHSHPNSYSVIPSGDDYKAFTWLQSHMNQNGLPALMFIVGETNKIGIYLGHMNIE